MVLYFSFCFIFALDDEPMQDSQMQGNIESEMQDFLPAVQKALLLHLNQNNQDSDNRRKEGHGCAPPSGEKGLNRHTFAFNHLF